MYDLIILGGGPAGVSAGIYASRKLIKALLLTEYFGGQSIVASKIENFLGYKEISGFELAKALENQLRSQEHAIDIKDGVRIEAVGKKDGFFEIKDSKGDVYRAKNLLMTFGSGYRKMGIPGEKEFEGKGVFYCATCDAPLMKNKKVVVVGAGNSGLGAVIDLSPYASEIFVFSKYGEIKGDPVLQEKVLNNPKVTVIYEAQAIEVLGNEFVTGIKYLDKKAGEEKILDVDGIFVEIGYKPNTDLVKGLVDLDEKGQIIVDHRTMQTSQKGIWAAGDVTNGLYNQINTATGDGVKALLNIYDSLKNS